jgi:hypothetical protein
VGYSVAGTYLESCNCEPICPCRRIGGRPGGRSTHGICLGALSWHVQEGHAEDLELSGLAVAIVYRYDDDEAGSPWTLTLHVDERASGGAETALADIFLGRLGGGRIEALPWVRKPCAAVRVHRSRIELDHVSERRWLTVADRAVLRVGRPVATDESVSCIVPGHDRVGHEYHAETLEVHDESFDAELVGVCAFSAPFAYASED